MRWIWKLNLWLIEGRGKRRNRKLKNKTKNNPGGRREEGDEEGWTKTAFWVPLTMGGSVPADYKPFFSEVQRRLWESKCLKDRQKCGEWRMLLWLSQQESPHDAGGRMLQTCPCGLGKFSASEAWSKSLGTARRLRSTKGMQLKGTMRWVLPQGPQWPFS